MAYDKCFVNDDSQKITTWHSLLIMLIIVKKKHVICRYGKKH